MNVVIRKTLLPFILAACAMFLAACREQSTTTAKEHSSSSQPVNESVVSSRITETTPKVDSSTVLSPETYSYEVIGGLKPVDLQYPFQIDKYLTDTSDGAKVFELDKLASDYGWKSKDGYYYYDFGDYWLKFEFTHGDITNEQNETTDEWVSDLLYSYVFPESPNDFYFIYDANIERETDGFEMCFQRDESQEVYLINSNIHVMRRQALIIAYILTMTDLEPGRNPVIHSPLWQYRKSGDDHRAKMNLYAIEYYAS